FSLTGCPSDRRIRAVQLSRRSPPTKLARRFRLALRWRNLDSNFSSLSGSVPLRAGGAVRGNHMVYPRTISPWRNEWFESISLQQRVGRTPLLLRRCPSAAPVIP